MRSRPVKDKDYADINWQDDAVAYAEMYGLSLEDVEKIVLSRTRPAVDPRSHEVGHLIVRYRAGDVVVVVGHREKAHPVIMSVWVETGQTKGGTKKTGGVQGSNAPHSMKDLTKRILAEGFKVQHGGSHMKVMTPEGNLLMSMPSTPSEYRSIANCWSLFLRKKAEYQSTKKEQG